MTDKKSGLKLIRAAQLIDGTGSGAINPASVLIRDGKILSVGVDENSISAEGQFEEFVFDTGTIMPGLVDSHVHLNGIGDGRIGDDLAQVSDEVLTLQSARNAREHLFSGVTTVRDCGAKNSTTFRLRNAIRMGITVGPRLVLSGRPISIIGGHLSYFGIEVTGPNECRAAVRQLVKEGADFIKVTATGGTTITSLPLLPSFNLDELKAICEEAHKFGLHVAAHCSCSQGIANALDAGVDTIIHAYFREPDGSNVFKPELADRIAQQGVFVNATLAGRHVEIEQLELKMEAEGLTDVELAELDENREMKEIRLEHFAKMREMGVVMVAGSDSAWKKYRMGGFQHEIHAHVMGGMSPKDSIIAATLDSARSCRIDDKVGSIELGKDGDILVVEGDPNKDIENLWNVLAVFQGGQIVDRGNRV